MARSVVKRATSVVARSWGSRARLRELATMAASSAADDDARRVGDKRGHRRQVGGNCVVEVEGEVGLDSQVGQPVPRARPGGPAEVDGTFKPVEADLGASRLPGASTCRGDVDRALLDDDSGMGVTRPTASAWRTSSRIRCPGYARFVPHPCHKRAATAVRWRQWEATNVQVTAYKVC